MFNWIFENKEWVFSGIGVLVINLIILLSAKISAKKKDNLPSNVHYESSGKGTIQARNIHGDINISINDQDEKKLIPKKKVSIRLIMLGIPIIIFEIAIGAFLINRLFFSSPIVVDSTLKSSYTGNSESKDNLPDAVQDENKHPDTKSKYVGYISGESIIKENDSPNKQLKRSIYVHRFKFEGNIIYSDDELSSIISLYQNSEITPEILQEVKHKLTSFYIENGYINSGAIIPNQKVEDGIIIINIIEGKIDKNNNGEVQLEISGGSPELRSYVTNHLKKSVLYGKYPLNIIILTQELKILKQKLGIKINAELSHGKEKGKSVLKVQIEGS